MEPDIAKDKNLLWDPIISFGNSSMIGQESNLYNLTNTILRDIQRIENTSIAAIANLERMKDYLEKTKTKLQQSVEYFKDILNNNPPTPLPSNLTKSEEAGAGEEKTTGKVG